LKLDRDRLQRAREMLGYSIEMAAREAGVSKNSVLRAEHKEDIRPVTARKIAAALGVAVADLIGESESSKVSAALSPEWALAAPDDNAFRQTIENAPTTSLKGLVMELVGGYQPRLFEDLDEEDMRKVARRVNAFARATVIGEELQRRGETPPENYILVLKRFADAMSAPADQSHQKQDSRETA
jgi:transcriptional regulator with XRE-family HTH domain